MYPIVGKVRSGWFHGVMVSIQNSMNPAIRVQILVEPQHFFNACYFSLRPRRLWSPASDIYVCRYTAYFSMDAWYKQSASYKGLFIGVHRLDCLHGAFID